jgi:deoxyribonuclease-4
VAGGLAKVGLPYAREIGAEVVQVFVSNPRGWAQHPGDPAQDAAFRDGCGEDGVAVYVHAPYLVNFGSPTPATVAKSADALRHSLARGREIGARGVVFHAGCVVSGHDHDTAMRQVRDVLRPVVADLRDDDPDVLVELTAGGRGSLVSKPDELPAYLDALEWHPKVGVCADTCHAMAAGHDLSAPGGLRSFLSAVAKHAGRARLLPTRAVQMESLQLQRPQLPFERAELDAQIEQRPEEHVPADSAENIQIKRFHSNSPAANALIWLAA